NICGIQLAESHCCEDDRERQERDSAFPSLEHCASALAYAVNPIDQVAFHGLFLPYVFGLGTYGINLRIRPLEITEPVRNTFIYPEPRASRPSFVASSQRGTNIPEA